MAFKPPEIRTGQVASSSIDHISLLRYILTAAFVVVCLSITVAWTWLLGHGLFNFIASLF
jgi:hypothetical protein